MPGNRLVNGAGVCATFSIMFAADKGAGQRATTFALSQRTADYFSTNLRWAIFLKQFDRLPNRSTWSISREL